MGLKGFYKTDVVTVSPDHLVTEAAQLMRDHHIGNVVVVREEGGKKIPVGLITDRDITIKCVANGAENIADLSVEEIMSQDLVCAYETEGVYEIAQKMRREGVARVPVVAEDGSLVGIITSMNLLALFSDELSEVVEIADGHREGSGPVSLKAKSQNRFQAEDGLGGNLPFQ